MKQAVEITVLNLCYNTGRYVVEALESVKAQTFRDFELIIVDDASTDNSVELLREWVRKNEGDFPITLIERETNGRICAALNTGLKVARGKYLSKIDDDIWHPEFLERLHKLLSSAPESVCMAYSKADVLHYHSGEREDYLDARRNVAESAYPHKADVFVPQGGNVYLVPGRTVQQCLFYSNAFVAFTVLIRLDLIKAAGWYDERFCIEDLPLWFIFSKQYDFLYLDEYLATYIRHDQSFTAIPKGKRELFKSVIGIYLLNSDLAKEKQVKKDLNETLFRYWYYLYRDPAVPRKEVLAYTRKLMAYSPYLFRKFSAYFVNKLTRDAKKKLFRQPAA